jgi:uncharacterized protein
VLPFFVVTFAWTWSMWWGAVAAGLSFDQDTFKLLYLLGVFGPMVGAWWVVRRGDRAYRREFWRRVWDPRRVPAAWWLALIGVAAGPALLGAAAAAMNGATAQAPEYSAGLVGAVIVFALVVGLAEEPGWRGAAVDAWQSRTGPVWAALGIGALWALWHLPLHFVEGSYQHGIGFGPARFWLTNLALIQLAVLLVWLVNGARGSILMAILAHAGFNAALGLVPASTTRDIVGLLLMTVTTLAVIAATRGRCGSNSVPDRRRPVRNGHDPHQARRQWSPTADATAHRARRHRLVLRLLGDRDTVATMLFPVFTAERAAAFVEGALASQARPEATYHRFVAVRDDPATPVGLAALMIRPDYKDAEIWYVIDPAHRGRGYATETMLRLLEVGFGDHDLHRIWANCVPTNVASLKVLERAGFRREGHFRESLPLHGRWEDCLHYALLRREQE